MPEPTASGIDWVAVKAAYENGRTLQQIVDSDLGLKADGQRISRAAIYNRAEREGWHILPKRLRDVTVVTDALPDPPDISWCKWREDYPARSPDNLAAICRLLEGGMGRVSAAKLAGMSPETLRTWTAEEPRVEEALARAAARGVGKRLKRLDAAAERGDARVDMWALERSPHTRDDFAPRSPAGHSGPGVQIVINVPAPGAAAGPDGADLIDVTPSIPAIDAPDGDS